MKEIPVPNDPATPPHETMIEYYLKDSYSGYILIKTFLGGLKSETNLLWNYYKDGKAWLCKAVAKKKTIFWLALYNSYFTICFYFTDTNLEKLFTTLTEEQQLEIKQIISQNKKIGRLIPVLFKIETAEPSETQKSIINFKITCK